MSDFETISVTVNEVNAPPGIGFISDKIVSQGSTLSFFATATDGDIPAQALTFSLDPGFPARASINPTNGLFTWTPSAAQASSTNFITVRVTDNGSPELSDVKTFSIVVNRVTELRLIELTMSSSGVVTLNWSSQDGKTYRVESKDDLNQTSWNTLGDFNATNSTTSATINVSGSPQRYYRIQQVN